MEAEHPVKTQDQFENTMQEHSIIIDSRTILDEPMPLVRSGKYSLIPDVIHGWKP